MATTRYLCTSCNRVIDFDNRKRNHDCPYCGKWWNVERMMEPTLINDFLYNGDLYLGNKTFVSTSNKERRRFYE